MLEPSKIKRPAAPVDRSLKTSQLSGTRDVVSHTHSIRRGLISHGEHLADLILVQGAFPGLEQFEVYRELCSELLDGIKAKKLSVVNEKIDESPRYLSASWT